MRFHALHATWQERQPMHRDVSTRNPMRAWAMAVTPSP